MSILDQLNLQAALRLARKKLSRREYYDAKRIFEDVLLKYPQNRKAIQGIAEISYDLNKVTSGEHDVSESDKKY